MAKFLVFLLVLGGFYWAYNKPNSEPRALAGAAFVAVPMPTEQEKGAVMIVAALNCPKAAAQHADYLTQQLRKKQIKVQRVNNVNFTYQNQTEAKAIQALMSQDPPLVFVKGYGSSRPSLEKVLEAVEKL